MNLEISEELSILPKAVFETKQIFKIVKDDKGETVTESVRKVTKGEFKQYALHLLDEKKDKRVAQYLFKNQLRNLVLEYGTNTNSWENNFVEITATPRTVGDETYYDLVISACVAPTWSEENI